MTTSQTSRFCKLQSESALRQCSWKYNSVGQAMEDHRLPNITFFGELASGFRDDGGQHKRYKDTLKKGLISSGIDHENWETTSRDRDSWRLQIKEATQLFETNRTARLEEKRHRRKNPDKILDQTKSYPCSRCGRVCLSRIGLISHQRACTR